MLEKIIKFGHDAEEPKKKRSNPGTMPENPKQKEGIESGSNAKELEIKGMDRIWAQCQRTRIKTKGSNLGAMPENPKQNEGIESWRYAREPEKKGRDQI